MGKDLTHPDVNLRFTRFSVNFCQFVHHHGCRPSYTFIAYSTQHILSPQVYKGVRPSLFRGSLKIDRFCAQSFRRDVSPKNATGNADHRTSNAGMSPGHTANVDDKGGINEATMPCKSVSDAWEHSILSTHHH